MVFAFVDDNSWTLLEIFPAVHTYVTTLLSSKRLALFTVVYLPSVADEYSWTRRFEKKRVVGCHPFYKTVLQNSAVSTICAHQNIADVVFALRTEPRSMVDVEFLSVVFLRLKKRVTSKLRLSESDPVSRKPRECPVQVLAWGNYLSRSSTAYMILVMIIIERRTCRE